MADENPNRRETFTADDFYILDSHVSDTDNLPRKIRGIIVGTAGNLEMRTARGENVAAIPVVAGQFLPVAPIRLLSNTTATNLLGLI